MSQGRIPVETAPMEGRVVSAGVVALEQRVQSGACSTRGRLLDPREKAGAAAPASDRPAVAAVAGTDDAKISSKSSCKGMSGFTCGGCCGGSSARPPRRIRAAACCLSSMSPTQRYECLRTKPTFPCKDHTSLEKVLRVLSGTASLVKTTKLLLSSTGSSGIGLLSMVLFN